MPQIRQFLGNGIANGTAITTSTAGTGDNAPVAVLGAPVWDTSFPNFPRAVFPTSSTVSRMGWSFTSQTRLSYRWGFWRPPGLTATVAITQTLGSNETAQTARVEVIPSGALRIRDAGNTQVGSDSTGLLQADVDYRGEVMISTAGLLTASVYDWVTGALVARTTGAGVGTAHDSLRIGGAASVANYPAHGVGMLIITNDEAEVGPPASYLFPASINTNGWTVTGAANAVAAVSDGQDSSFTESPGPNTPIHVFLRGMVRPSTDWVVPFRVGVSNGTAVSYGVTLTKGATVLATATVSPSSVSSIGNMNATFSGSALSTTDANDWKIEGTLSLTFTPNAT